jgi:hypothetical protein
MDKQLQSILDGISETAKKSLRDLETFCSENSIDDEVSKIIGIPAISEQLNALIAHAVHPSGASCVTLRRFYRCADCGTTWDRTGEKSTDSGTCPDTQCQADHDEPYYAIHDRHVCEMDRLIAESEHEKKYPVASQAGRYSVAVTRTEYACKDIEVTEEGPANAQLKALDEAGDHCFSSHEAEYGINGSTQL